MPKEIIKFEQLDFFIESVTEEISKSNLFMFTKTLFEKKHYPFNKNLKIIPLYLHFSKEYFFLFYKDKNEKTLEFEYFSTLLSNSLNTLIIYKDYFFLFEKREFYYFQKIEQNLNNDEIELFVNKRFNFKVEKTVFITENEFKNLSKKDNTLNLHYLKRLIPIYSFFILFSLTLFLPYIFYLYMDYKNDLSYENRVSVLQNKIDKNLRVKKDEYLYKKLMILFKNLKDKDIKALELNYIYPKVSLSLQSINKQNLYSFFKSCKKLSINSMIYKRKENIYESKISFLL